MEDQFIISISSILIVFAIALAWKFLDTMTFWITGRQPTNKVETAELLMTAFSDTAIKLISVLKTDGVGKAQEFIETIPNSALQIVKKEMDELRVVIAESNADLLTKVAQLKFRIESDNGKTLSPVDNTPTINHYDLLNKDKSS